MSRTQRLRLHQSAALAVIPPQPARPDPNDPTTTVMLLTAPPMSMREALLTDSRWRDLTAVLREKELARRRKQADLEEESCGFLDHPPTDNDYHGSGRWVDGEYVEDKAS
jgi:hypothetical protein